MIFVVEDDPNIRELVTYTLQSTGFDACGFENGSEFLKALSDGEKPELVLLDIMLPGEDGISILGKLRKKSVTKDLPIIMMTAKGTEYDKVLGLDSGADDYITKPFGMMELVSRVKAVLRRSNRNEKKDEIVIGQLKIYPNKHKVKSCGNEVTLTNKEFKLLCLLVESKGNVLNRDQLLTNIWGYDFDGETRTVDVHIRSLRQKLENVESLSRRSEESVTGSEAMNHEMKQKILNNMVYIAVVAVLITTTLIGMFTYYRYMEQIKTGMKDEAAYLAASLNFEDQQNLDKYKNITITRITRIAKDGTVIYDSSGKEKSMGNHKNRTEVKEAFKHGHGEDTRMSMTLRNRLIIMR